MIPIEKASACWIVIRLARNMKFRAREIHVTHWVALASSAPHFEDEIASLKKRLFFAGFQLFLAQVWPTWLILMGITWIFYEEIVPSSLFPAAVRPWTFWYTPGKGCHRLLNWQIQITWISWVGQSTRQTGRRLCAFSKILAKSPFFSFHCLSQILTTVPAMTTSTVFLRIEGVPLLIATLIGL